MKLGTFSVMQQRDPSKSPGTVLAEALEQTIEAERFGFDYAWYPEHHFNNYSLCPSPLVMAAHAAALTKTIRIGTAVLILPLYAPARLIEEIALVDILSKGRLELGVGSGYQKFEFDRFNVTMDDYKPVTHELIEMIEAGLTQSHFAYDGKHFKQPDTAISLRPFQNPMPPMWFATFDPGMMRRAARSGHGIFITGWLGNWKRLAGYREVIDEAYRAEGKNPAQAKVGLLRFCYASESKADVEKYVECARYQQRLGNALKFRRESAAGGYYIEEKPYDDELPWEKMLENIPVGDVDTVAERLVRDIRAIGAEQVSVIVQVGDLEQRKVLKSMELLADRVMPLVRKALGPDFPYQKGAEQAESAA